MTSIESAVADITGDYASAVSAPDNPVREGYAFGGWNISENLSGELFSFGTMPAEDVTLYASWTINTYTIYYDPRGGTNNAGNPTSYDVEDDFTLLPATRTGYLFGGWYTNTTWTTEVTVLGENVGELILYALWYQSYSITYELNSGVNNPSNPSTYNTIDDTFEILAPTRTDYDFAGWYSDSSLNTPADTTIEKGNTGNKIFYAKWTLHPYAITYVLLGGDNGANPETYCKGDNIVFYAPTRTGYEFMGWYIDQFYNTSTLGINSSASGDITVYARWAQVPYSITYIENGGSTVPDFNGHYQDTVTPPIDPEKDGYTFTGWYSDLECTTGYTFGAMPAESFSLYAGWEIVEYDITYYLGDGLNAPANPSTYTILDQFTLSNPSLEGYVFGGWYEDAGLGIPAVIEFNERLGALSFYAEWYELFDITYINIEEGENDLNPESYSELSSEIILSDPEREGFSFAGWFSDEEFTIPCSTISEDSTGDVTFYAKWLETYTITYYLDGGDNGIGNPSYYYVETETFTIADPDKTGHEFQGWFSDDEFLTGADIEIETGSSGDLTFYAKWQILEFTITFDSNGGSAVSPITQDYGTTVNAPAEPLYTDDPENILFMYWTLSELDEEEYVFTTMPAEDITLYAVWLPKFGYRVENGNAIIISIHQNFEGALNIPTTLDGHAVVGIDDNAFEGNIKITSVVLGNTLMFIGDYAFKDCTSIYDYRCSAVQTVGIGILEGCTALEHIEIALTDNVTLLTDYLGETVPAGLTYVYCNILSNELYDNAFRNFDTLETVWLNGSSCNEIGAFAFEDCTSLSLLILPNVTTIGNYAFRACQSLTMIDLSYCTSVGTGILEFCDSIETITACFNSYTLGDLFDDSGDNSFPLSLSNIAISIHSEEIAAYAFKGISFIGDVIIPASVDSIGDYAYSLSGITSITFAEGLLTIGEEVFSDTAIESVEFPSSLTSIGNSAFAFCGNLSDICFNSDGDLTKIGEYAFTYCGMSELTVPSSVTSIDDYAFIGCFNLTTVTMNNPASAMGIGLFNSDSPIAEMTIPLMNDKYLSYYFGASADGTAPDTLTTVHVINSTIIPAYGFYYCSFIDTITLEDGIEYLGAYSFGFTTSLCNLTLPDSIDTISSCSFYDSGITSVNIPANLTYLSSSAFARATSLETVIWNEDIETIAAYAFSESGITEADMSELASLTLIESSAFASCVSLTAVSIPEGVTEISDACYADCENLSSVEMAGAITEVGSSAFECCTLLTEIEFKTGLTKISQHAFQDSGLTSIELPSTVNNVGNYAFYNCSNLTSAKLPANLSTVGLELFYGCSNLQYLEIPFKGEYSENSPTYLGYYFGHETPDEITDVPETLATVKVLSPTGYTTIGSGAFKNLNNITTVIIPNTITSIGDSAFYNCSNLSSVTIPSSLQIIGDDVFYNAKFSSIDLPFSVNTIGDNAFSNCTSLTYFYMPEVLNVGEGILLNCNSIETARLVLGDSTSDNSFLSYYWGGTDYSDNSSLVPATLTTLTIVQAGAINTLKSYAISSCASLETVNLSGTIRIIEDNTFLNCASLTAITLPTILTSIGDYAFKGCTLLTSLIINSSETLIGTAILEGNTSLEALSIPFEDTTVISHFWGGTNYLNNVDIPTTLTEVTVLHWGNKLANQAFENCDYIESISLADTIEIIGSRAFYGCNLLATLNIPAALTEVGASAFQGLTEVESIILPEIVTEIGNDAFRNCSGLTSCSIPQAAATIGTNVLTGCVALETLTAPLTGTNYYVAYYFGGTEWADNTSLSSTLTTFSFPENTTEIPNRALSNCNYITTIGIPEGLATINNSAFTSSGVTSIALPDVTSIGNYAFQNCGALDYVSLGEDLEIIGTSIFMGCSMLSTLSAPFAGSCQYLAYYFGGIDHEDTTNIPPALESFIVVGSNLPSYAFYNCSSLISITFPNDLTEIPDYAFYGCTGITEITLSNNIGSIGNSAFENCTSLITLRINKPADFLADVISLASDSLDGCTALTNIYVPNLGSATIYQTADNWISYSAIIGVEVI
jgi:uncharacterized repeat protein (TIGR02543 family)